MIRNSFIFLPKVAASTEKKIWSQGIHSWEDFLGEKTIDGISPRRKPHHDRLIGSAKDNLYRENSIYFTGILPTSQHWRLYNFFKDNACFLDIETTGYHGDTTVLGMYDGYDTKMFVKGKNLYRDKIIKELSNYKMLVTFNGASFDLPVLRKQFNLDFDVPHVDLRFAAGRIGLTGGLKRIEKEIGIKRAEEVSDVTGEDAVYLWRQYRATGNEKYLNLLVQYNEEDIINLKQLAEFVIPRLWKKTKES